MKKRSSLLMGEFEFLGDSIDYYGVHLDFFCKPELQSVENITAE
jgi:hypothetical protein